MRIKKNQAKNKNQAKMKNKAKMKNQAKKKNQAKNKKKKYKLTRTLQALTQFKTFAK
jgi:hypothetical protein